MLYRTECSIQRRIKYPEWSIGNFIYFCIFLSTELFFPTTQAMFSKWQNIYL